MTEEDQYDLQLASFRVTAFDIAIKLAATANTGANEDQIFKIYERVISKLDLPS